MTRWRAWDVPAGRVAPGEEPGAAAARAAIEETGWRPGAGRRLGLYHPSPGISDQRFGVYVAETAEKVGEPNPHEVERVEWVPVERVRQLLRDGEVDGLSLTSLLWALSADELTELRLDSSDLEPGITVDGVTYRWRGQLIDAELVSLVRSHGGRTVRGWWDQIRPHSLGWVTARAADGAVVGFVNIAWDGGDHAFLLDPKTHGEFQRKGIGTRLVEHAVRHARTAGCEWLHVDFETELEPFFFDTCGFRPTPAGLIHLPSLGDS